MEIVKYAALLIDRGIDTTRHLDSNGYIGVIDLDTFLDSEKTNHWKKWIGDITWDEIKRAKSALVIHCPTETPDVLNSEY